MKIIALRCHMCFCPKGSVYQPSKDCHVLSGVSFTIYLRRRLGGGRGSPVLRVLEEEGCWRSCRSQVCSLLRPVKGRQKPAGLGKEPWVKLDQPLTQQWPQTAAPVWVSVHSQRGFRTSGCFGGQWVGTEALKRLDLSAHAPARKNKTGLRDPAASEDITARNVTSLRV